ncbi:hypothetical protein Cgig2_023455 [Carnegiea gigantea]|uniref:Uncharacterized protein n=1 Tax=Carnegiea gigantea TaxID=171969 RepID=A0A9Q1JNG9_9CARY|nr:hypothetical protein Cgig2_023455 [Carnegiea gigantea]
MEELGISLNLNSVACLLKLRAYEEARNHCELAFKFDFSNVKTQFRRAQASLHLGMVEKVYEDLLLALEFDPVNDEVKLELLKVKQMCTPTCVTRPMGHKETRIDCPIELPSSLAGAKFFDPLNLGNSSQLECSSQMSPSNGKVAERKRDLDFVENSARPLSKRPCLNLNKKELFVEKQGGVTKGLEFEDQDMSSNISSCVEHTSSSFALNTILGLESRFDSTPTKSPTVQHNSKCRRYYEYGGSKLLNWCTSKCSLPHDEWTYIMRFIKISSHLVSNL